MAMNVPAVRRWLAVLGVLLWVLVGVAAVDRQLHSRSADFREFYKATAHLLGTIPAEGVVVPFSYPPAFHLLIAPLTALPLGVAAALWYALCSGLAFWTLRSLHRLGGGSRLRDLLIPTLISLGLIINDLLMGNANLVILACLVGGLIATTRERHALAGGVVALGAAIKLLPVLVLPYVIYRGRGRALLGAALGGGLGVAVPLLVLGPEVVLPWLEKLPAILGLSDPGDLWFARDEVYRGTNQSLRALLHRFLRPIPAIRGTDPMGTVNLLSLPVGTVEVLYRVLAVGLVAAVAATVARVRRAEPGLVWSLVVIAMLMLSRVTWVNYLVHLTLVYFVLYQEAAAAPAGSARRRWLAGGLGWGLLASLLGAAPLTQAFGVPAAGAMGLGAAIGATLWMANRGNARE